MQLSHETVTYHTLRMGIHKAEWSDRNESNPHYNRVRFTLGDDDGFAVRREYLQTLRQLVDAVIEELAEEVK